MKLIFSLSLLLTMTLGQVYAQYDSSYDQYPFEKERIGSALYLDLSSGIDNHTGVLGIGATIPISNYFALRGGIGIGVWGTKLSVGLKRQNLLKMAGVLGLAIPCALELKILTLHSQIRQEEVG